MFAPITRRHFLRGALTAVAAAACLLPAATPAHAAKKFNPNSPKGTFRGTYHSVTTEGKTGTLTFKVTNEASVRGTKLVRRLTGYLTLDRTVRNKKAFGSYLIETRLVALTTPVRTGLALSVAGVLSEDGRTIEQGQYAVLNTKTGQIVDQGTCELTHL